MSKISETEKLAKGLNRGMRFAAWLIVIVATLVLGTCVYFLS